MLSHYLSVALRHFMRHKLVSAINVACLTIGLVCFLAIYAVLMYLRNGDGHYPNADRIYMLNQSSNSSLTASAAAWNAGKYLRVEFPELETVARATFSGVAPNELPVSSGDRKGFVYVSYADPEFLDVFAFPFLAGDSRNALRSPASTVLSESAATRFFGGASEALGRTLRLPSGQEVTVRGVVGQLRQPSHIRASGDAAPGTVRFDALISMDVLESLAATDPMWRTILTPGGAWGAPLFLTYAVLPKDDSLTADSFRRRLASFGARYANSPGNVNKFGAVPISEYWLGGIGAVTGSDKTGIPVSALFYFLGFIVLLTSCLNYSNLATAQATTRAKEIGMRRVVGARRAQIVAQFMFEAALLSGAALACALAVVLVVMLVTNLPGITFVVSSVVASRHFWLTLLALLAIVTVAAGLYPAFVLSAVRPIRAAQAGKVRSGGRLMPRLLVGLQFAAASFLTISMLVMLAQNGEFKRSVLSSSADTLVTISNSLRQAGIDYEVLRTELMRQPSVTGMTASSLPLAQMIGNTQYTAVSPDEAAKRVPATFSAVNYDFFSTLEIPLLAGRGFARDRDDRIDGRTNDTPANVVIDRALAAQQGWSTPAEAVGKTLYIINIGAGTRTPSPRTVIGVVENRAMTLVSPFGATANGYQLNPAVATLPIVRVAAGQGAAALGEIETVWSALAPTVALKMEFADQTLNRAYGFFEIITSVFLRVAALALSISVLGLIGMSIQVIGRRQHEIGVRKTLGASVASVVRLLLADFSRPVLIANLVAWPLAYVVMNLYLSVFTLRTGLSPAPFLISLASTLIIAWIAVSAQATRAARMKPAEVLRYE